MKAPPILYFKLKLSNHYSDAPAFGDYFSYSVRVSKNHNPDSAIIIIGDENPKYEGTTFVHVKDLQNRLTDHLDKFYMHLSNNHADFELAAIKKWSYFAEYLFQTSTDRAVLCDLDLWVVRKVEELFAINPKGKIGTHLHQGWERLDGEEKAGACGHLLLMNDLPCFLDTISSWGELFTDMHTNFEKSLIGRWYNQRIHPEAGVTDMILLAMSSWKYPDYFWSTKGFQSDGSLFDVALNQEDGLILENGVKQLFKHNDKYYGVSAANITKLHQINTLHAHGSLKAISEGLYYKYEQ